MRPPTDFIPIHPGRSLFIAPNDLFAHPTFCRCPLHCVRFRAFLGFRFPQRLFYPCVPFYVFVFPKPGSDAVHRFNYEAFRPPPCSSSTFPFLPPPSSQVNFCPPQRSSFSPFRSPLITCRQAAAKRSSPCRGIFAGFLPARIV